MAVKLVHCQVDVRFCQVDVRYPNLKIGNFGPTAVFRYQVMVPLFSWTNPLLGIVRWMLGIVMFFCEMLCFLPPNVRYCQVFGIPMLGFVRYCQVILPDFARAMHPLFSWTNPLLGIVRWMLGIVRWMLGIVRFFCKMLCFFHWHVMFCQVLLCFLLGINITKHNKT